uniref:Uncharacterized protein n=1 Tax=Salix viminalis TaxID=40686 RepID=A0A6N2N6Z6_SALVM
MLHLLFLPSLLPLPTTSAFGNTGFAQPGFGGQRPGTRAAPYAETAEAEGGAQAGKLVSISAMPAYKDKSHEELRWEDYQLGDKASFWSFSCWGWI